MKEPHLNFETIFYPPEGDDMNEDIDTRLFDYAREWKYLGITVLLLAAIFWYGGDDLRLWMAGWGF